MCGLLDHTSFHKRLTGSVYNPWCSITITDQKKTLKMWPPPWATIRRKRRGERRGEIRDSSQFQKTEKLWFYCKKVKSAESNHFLVDNHEQLGCEWIFLSQKRVLSTPYSFAAHSVLTFYQHIKNKGGGSRTIWKFTNPLPKASEVENHV